MKKLIKRQISNICSIYQAYDVLDLLFWPRNAHEIQEFEDYVADVLEIDSIKILPMSYINFKSKINKIIILDIDNVLLINNQITSDSVNRCLAINQTVVSIINGMNLNNACIVLVTNHITEDIRPIFKRSVDIVLSRLTNMPYIIIQNIGNTNYNSKAYIVLLLLSKMLQNCLITSSVEIYQYEGYLYCLRGISELLSSDLNKDIVNNLIKYHDISMNIVFQASDIYKNAKLYYVGNNLAVDQYFINDDIRDDFDSENIHNVMPFGFPCYLLLSLK